MADIDVVPKHRSHLWLWILLAVIVIAVIVWSLANRSHAVSELHHAPATDLAQLILPGQHASRG
jgi:bacteriorhodopsin